MKKSGLFFTIVLGVVLLIACNKTTTKDTPESTGVKSDKIQTSVYPHEKDFFKNHGGTYSKNKEQCLSCHAKDGSGGTANVSCLQCHKGFPHPQNWVMPDQHPAAYKSNPQSCATCHGEDYKGGKSKVSCQQCHQGFPHPLEWSKPDQHGQSYVGLKDKKQCLSCHDQSKATGALATRCDSCHKAFPHDKSFKNGNKVHKTLAGSYEGKCLNCHRDYKENMPNYQDPDEGLGCLGCHEGSIKIDWKKDAPPPPSSTTPPAAGDSGKPNTFHKTKKGERLPTNSEQKKINKK